MCWYVGGKKRIAKEIHDVMIQVEKEIIGEKLPYFEPFCGMLSIAVEFDDGRQRYACDVNKDVISMWKAVINKNWKPPKMTVTKTYFDILKQNTNPSPERGFYGSTCTYRNFFMGGFDINNYKRSLTNSWKNITNMKPKLKHINILDSKSYLNFNPQNMLIYCDPPYKSSLGNINVNKYLNEFDTTLFWDVMRKWSKNNLVFISEETAPKDFKCIWKKEVNRPINGKIKIEKLYVKL